MMLLGIVLLFTGCHKRLDERISNLEQHNAALYTSKEFHDLLVDFSASYLIGVRDSLSVQSSEVSTLQGHYVILKAQSDATQTLLDETVERHENLKGEVAKAQADILSGQQKQAALEVEMAQARIDLQDAIAKHGALSKEAEQLNSDIQGMKNKYDALAIDIENAQKKADSVIADCAAMETEIAAIKVTADKASSEAKRVETELNSKLSALESSVLALQQNMVITSLQTDAKGHYIIKYKEGKDGEEKTINVANSENLNFSKVNIKQDNLAYTFTINNNGNTETFTIPALRDFITSIVIVSDTYVDNATKKPAINIVLNTANGVSLDGVVASSFYLTKGQTKSSVIDDFDDVKIFSIERVTDSKVPNEFIVAFDNISQDYTGLHILWNPNKTDAVKVLSPAFDLSNIPVVTSFYLLVNPSTSLTDGVLIREKHNHSGSGCSNIAFSSTSVTYYAGLKPDANTVLAANKIEKVEVEVLKLKSSIVTTDETTAKDLSFWVAYDVKRPDLDGEVGFDGTGLVHEKGFKYDYYNGNAVDYNVDKATYGKILGGYPSNFDAKNTVATGFSVSYDSSDKRKFTIRKANPEQGLYGVIIWVKRVDGVYARGIGYIWIA